MKPMICVFLAPSDRHAQRPLVWSCFQVRGKLPFSSSDNVSTATQSILLVTTAPRFRSSDPVDTFHCNKFASYNVCNKQGSLWTLILLHDCWARETIQALVLCGGRRQQHYLFNGSHQHWIFIQIGENFFWWRSIGDIPFQHLIWGVVVIFCSDEAKQ